MPPTNKAKRPYLPAISEEMKRMSVLLAAELLTWPGVSSHPMFGLQAFYREGVVFAMLPVKRGFESPNGIAYKLASSRKGLKWRTFEVESEEDVGKALAVLEKAYARAVSK
jgi:hypothetical protein